ncbi:hypothetical protein [Billgrantia desiderata]|uniref:hypothetical protein n=1 Tax=Billgrantia desiderata TaxID=52021 RepID=UPI00089F33CD|nr:hypothetical protein [Halomonas desiderata]SEG29922.1 hypothetical protein SAMN04487953_12216 [Halomonas desiderata]
MTAGIFGLIGVICGSLLTALKEWWLQSLSNKRNSAYLAARVSILLDKFVLACAEVVADDGLCYGQPDKDGYHSPQVDPPSLELQQIEVEWRSLPVRLMYEILDLPYKTEVAERRIQGVKEHVASPPEFVEFFEERQLQYAQLGLLAADLSTRLREHAKLPARLAGAWDPISYMQDAEEKITKLREQRALDKQAWLREQEVLQKLI